MTGNYRLISLAITMVLDRVLNKYIAQFGYQPVLYTEPAILCLKYTVRTTPIEYASFCVVP